MIVLEKVSASDTGALHAMQVRAFQPLLERYRDTETNPAAESVDRVLARLENPQRDYYFIVVEGVRAGAMNIWHEGENARISPIFLLPEYQGRGFAQQAMALAESLYPQAQRWSLDTIKQEPRLCRLYEEMGYRRTGEEKRIKDGLSLVFYEKIVKG